MPQPAPYPPNRLARRGLWMSLGFWVVFPLLYIAVAEDLLPFGVALALWLLTIAAGIWVCIVACRRPPRTVAVLGLLVSAFNLVVVLLILLAAATASGLARFR